MFSRWIKAAGVLTVFMAASAFLILNADKGHQLPAGKMPVKFNTTSEQLFGDYDEWTSELAHFWRTTYMDGFKFEYKWIDYQGQMRSFSQQLSFQTWENAISQFGISPQTRKQYYTQQLGLTLQINPVIREIADLIRNENTPVHLKYHSTVSEDKYNIFTSYLQNIENNYLSAQGFYYKTDDLILIDYANVIQTHTPSMRSTALNFAQSAGLNSWTLGDLVEHIMSFTQVIQYMMPPMRQDNRLLYGLWAPTESLVSGRGDCDTKAVLFASIVNHYKTMKPAVITIPGHAFNGLIGWHKRLPQDTVIQYRGQDILLLDLTSTNNYLTRGAINEYDKQHIRNRFPTIFIPES